MKLSKNTFCLCSCVHIYRACVCSFYSCVCILTPMYVGCVHAFTFVFFCSHGCMIQPAYACRVPAYAYAGLRVHVGTQKPLSDYFNSFFNFFPIHIASWYRVLIDDTKAFIRATGFEPVIHLLLESHASAILVQSLAERWWDATHTFHTADMEMTVTPYDFHWMTGL